MTLNKLDIIKNLLEESKSYGTLEQIEALVQSGEKLDFLPIQPLYLVLKKLSPEVIAANLEKFTPEQRKAFLNIDLWNKDHLEVDDFNLWLRSYATCPHEHIRMEFATSSEFSIYLKGKFNIATFDV